MSNTRSIRLSLVHSLEARLKVGLLLAWALTIGVVSVFYFVTRAFEDYAHTAANADKLVLELSSFALSADRYVDISTQAFGESASGADRAARRAAETRMSELVDQMTRAAIPEVSAPLDWRVPKAVSRQLHDAFESAGELRREGKIEDATRILSDANTLLNARLLPWLDQAIAAERDFASHREVEIFNRMRAFGHVGNVLGACLAALTAMVLWLTLRALTRPLNLLIEGTSAIARGDYSHRINYDAKDELGVLALRFDNMAATIEASQREMVDKNRALEQAYQLQGEFLSMMSHELRSPLHSILGYTELVVDGSPSLPEISRGNLTSIEKSARRQLALIDDILDFSKLKVGRMELRTESVDVATLAAEVLADARALTLGRSVDLRLELAADVTAIVSDEAKLRQVLTNLLSNAVKFCERGSVTLRVHRFGNEGVAFSVSDTGIGIPEDQQKLIFEPFRQVQGSKAVGGTGLGLAIVSRLVSLLGGSVTVSSAVGRGSEFSVCLPIHGGAAWQTS